MVRSVMIKGGATRLQTGNILIYFSHALVKLYVGINWISSYTQSVAVVHLRFTFESMILAMLECLFLVSACTGTTWLTSVICSLITQNMKRKTLLTDPWPYYNKNVRTLVIRTSIKIYIPSKHRHIGKRCTSWLCWVKLQRFFGCI